MNELDRSLSRAWAIGLEDLSDETDAELGLYSPARRLWVRGDRWRNPTGYFWRFTPDGVQRVDALGLDAADE